MHKTHKQNINKQHQNINKQLYLNSHYVLYIASKQLRDYAYCFAIIDVKARHIVSHFYKATPPNLGDMIDCLSSLIKESRNKGWSNRPHPICCSLIARKSMHNKLTDFHELMRDKAALRAFLDYTKSLLLLQQKAYSVLYSNYLYIIE